MTQEERRKFTKELVLESSKGIMSGIDLEKQIRRTSDGIKFDCYAAHVASTIVCDFVKRTIRNLENDGIL